MRSWLTPFALVCLLAGAALAGPPKSLPLAGRPLVQRLEKAAKAGNTTEVDRVIRTLAVIGPQAADALAKALEKQPTGVVLLALLGALSRLDPEARQLAGPFLKSADARVRSGAARALDGADPQLLMATLDGETALEVQVALIESLAAAEGPTPEEGETDNGALDPIVTERLVLESQAGPTARRVAAVDGLFQRRDRSSLKAVLGLLADSERDVRRAAVRVIGEMGDRESVERLVEQAATETDPAVKSAIFEALRTMTGQGIPDDPAAWKRWLARGA